jgi:hypothetical protein
MKQVGRERMQEAPREHTHFPEPARPRLRTRHHPRHHVSVPSDELRGAVHYQSRAVAKRLLQDRRRERGVHQHGDSVGPSRLVDDILDICELERRIDRRFDDDQRRVRPHRAGHAGGVGPTHLRA